MPAIATLKGLRCPHCGGEQLAVTGVKGALGASAVTSLAFGAVGNLVAGKSAAANTTTEPLQYKCTNCGNKFESLPLGAPPEEILDEPCTVTFTREGSMIGAAVPQILYLNGVKLGAVKNGVSLSFSTSSRYNVLFVTDHHGVAFKSEYRFEAQPGGSVATRFKLGFHDAPAVSVSPVATETPRAQISMPDTPPVRFCTNCGGALGEGTLFCPVCGEKRFAPQPAKKASPTGMQTMTVQTKPQKAVVAFGLLAGAWLFLLLFQGIVRGKLLFSADTTFFIVAAMLGGSIYLLLQKDRKHKLYGALGGIITTFLYAGTSMAVMLNNRMGGAFSLAQALNFTEPYYWSSFWRALAFVALTMGSALGAWSLLKTKEERTRLRLTAWTGAAMYALCGIVSWVVQYGLRMGVGQLPFPALLSTLIGFAGDSIILHLSIRGIDSLCKSEKSRVELFGIGKVWAWIAAVAMALSIAVVFATAFGGMSAMGYTASLLLAIAGATGYILLLCKRRVGLSFILSAAVLVLGGQLSGSLSALFYGNGRYAALLFGSILGAVNPLFAWLAVRAADRRGFVSPEATAMPLVSQSISSFQKFVAIFNTVIGGLLILPVIGNAVADPEPAFLITFLFLIGVYLSIGILSVTAQHSRTRPYPKWIKIVGVILFSIGTLLISVALFGLIITALN